MIEIIPKSCLSIIPFTAEALSSWSEDSELLTYLKLLCDKEGEFIDQEGRRFPVNYSSYGNTLYEEGRKHFEQHGKGFRVHARRGRPAPAAEDKMEDIPVFVNDKNFGLMAKYSIAWSGTVDEVLSEGAFFSLAHILESESELDCSVLLASRLYYKQALQVLRNFLEGIVAEIFFCENSSAFASWKANAYRNPSLRGKGGMLEDLFTRGVLSRDLVSMGSDLYGDLNGSIHGAENRLIHTGAFNKNWTGLIFKYQSFSTWTGYFARCVDFAVRVLKINIDLWQQLSSMIMTGIQCNVCHKLNDFLVEKSSFAGVDQSTLECRKCGNRMTFDSEFVKKRGLG